MTFERLLKAAEPVLAGDESIRAAAELERVVLDEHLEDVRFADLSDALALYAPGSGMPYVNANELRSVLERTIRDLGLTEPDADRGSR
jgi:hypothetical protein